ncbi:kunitz-type serine protease inhibitor Hg1 [Drosophila willistoni]|uniref:kunitz-type serine protease inhibitor Hg1 n=1 Tax=Drosophila willistoni TaxID=7260 RepID=UPI000C26D2A6|nr:kunitz-type serine protease inhibitor Hg1 [Drosophila willistoni]
MRPLWTILVICSLWSLNEAGHIDYVGDYIIRNELCLFVPSYGVCRGRFRAFGYDYRSNRCILFFYSGCGGNANRFQTENECRRRCRYDQEDEGTVPNYDYSSSSTTEDYYDLQPTMEMENYPDHR